MITEENLRTLILRLNRNARAKLKSPKQLRFSKTCIWGKFISRTVFPLVLTNVLEAKKLRLSITLGIFHFFDLNQKKLLPPLRYAPVRVTYPLTSPANSRFSKRSSLSNSQSKPSFSTPTFVTHNY